ncbi:hypothetical protein Zmor_019858 [Zophobas morio]|uniref:Ricin B lectin domain-containing protein n=1 Tax=Zophobas morio TaxID=2755281 RepID=A0AA38M9U5_9CUCU|nr:hypothetical protein Zmor_019858 [Zophobas morio]
MAFHQRSVPLTLVVLFATLCHIASPYRILYNKLYVIRNSWPNDLVLDATNQSQITIQPFSGLKTQLWKFEAGTEPGLFYIVNEYQGKVLDYNRPNSRALRVADRDNSKDQQWIISFTGKITNARTKKNVDIWRRDYSPGTKVGLWSGTGYRIQKFALDESS